MRDNYFVNIDCCNETFDIQAKFLDVGKILYHNPHWVEHSPSKRARACFLKKKRSWNHP